MSVAAQFEANASEDLSSPFYFNASHWRAMDGVVEGVKQREGIMILTGPTGSGKTMLMRAISDSLGEGVMPLFLQYASLNFREFVNFLHNSLNVGDEVLEASNKAVALRKFLYQQAERHETAVVFVDEAQNLEPDVLRMLPKLACFDQLEDGTNVGLQFMLTGGSELREVLEDSDFSEVRNAIAHEYELRFFTREELKYFLEKRLAPLARLTPEPITDEAIEAVGKYTGGSPRLIGMICSHAMLFAAENPGRSIDEQMIEEAAEALMIEPAENLFAHEDEELSPPAGPFSSADLSGDDTAGSHEKVDEDLSAIDTPISGMVDDAYDDSSISEEDIANFSAEEGEAEIPEMSDVMNPMSSSLDVDDLDDDLDDEFEDSGFALEDAAAPAAGAIAGGSMLSRVKSAFSGRAKKRGELNQIKGAGRKGRMAERSAAPTEKRKMKTRVAGQRAKQIKYAGYAAAFCALAFGAYMIRTDVSEVFASAKDSVTNTAASAYETVSSVGTDATTFDTSQQAEPFQMEMPIDDDTMEVAALEPNAFPDPTANLTVDPVSTQPMMGVDTPVSNGSVGEGSVKKSGWGAEVEVLQPLPKPGRIDLTAPKLPEASVGFARGALDLLDSALDKTKDVLPEDMGGAIDVAKGDVQDLRSAAAANGAKGEEREERVAKLVAEGNKYFKQGLYIAPPRGNAYDSYRAALDIDENNENALEGIEDLRAFYSQKAEAARDKKQWDRANRFFETALGISKRKPVR